MKVGITNLKGGVGKTTLSINLAVCFTYMGYKTCIIDTDTNQNSSAWYAARDPALPDVTVVGATEPKALYKVVNRMHETYDIVIMDGTPSLGEMSTRIMAASDLLIIPTRPGAHDFRAMQEFINRLDHVRELSEFKPVAVFFINEYDERYNLHQTVKESLAQFEIPILTSVLKSRTAYGESNLSGTGAYEHSDEKAKNEITILTNEIISIAETNHFLN